MGPGGIATIIAASSLAVIALAMAYVVIRVGRLVDEASKGPDAAARPAEPSKVINFLLSIMVSLVDDVFVNLSIFHDENYTVFI